VGDTILEALKDLVKTHNPNQHPVNYWIYKGLIYTRSRNFVPVVYTLSNPHIAHIHISIMRSQFAREWKGNWGIYPVQPPPKPKEWDEMATKQEIKDAIREVVREEVEAALDDALDDQVEAFWRAQLTHPGTNHVASARAWLMYANSKIDEVKERLNATQG
jgi:hypothetical protein